MNYTSRYQRVYTNCIARGVSPAEADTIATSLATEYSLQDKSYVGYYVGAGLFLLLAVWFGGETLRSNLYHILFV